jgi:hypothetical protein
LAIPAYRLYNAQNDLKSLKWNDSIMIRNLLASAIILAASTSAFADMKADIANGATAADLVTKAAAACAGSNSCQELALEEMLAAGVDIDTVAAAAVDAGMSVTTIVNAAIAADVAPTAAITAATGAAVKSGQSVDAVMAEAQTIPGVPAADAIAAAGKGAVQGGADTDTVETLVTTSIAKQTQETPTAGGNTPVANKPATKPVIPTPFVPAGTEQASISPAT